jgi:hypothetical protein
LRELLVGMQAQLGDAAVHRNSVKCFRAYMNKMPPSAATSTPKRWQK